MFKNNKYTRKYYQIVNRALNESRVKNDIFVHKHHIIPRSLRGTNDKSNLVLLSFKEHRVCHCLLTKMCINKNDEIKMIHAYGFFNKSSRFNPKRYKRGSDNIFSTQKIKDLVHIRMKFNNPMHCVETKQRAMETRRIRYLTQRPKPHVWKDKYITPIGTFKHKKQMIREGILPEWTCDTIFENLDSLPQQNNRLSKKLDKFFIDRNKTWRENGFDIISDDVAS